MNNFTENDIREEINDRIYNILYDEPRLVIALKERYLSDDIWKFCIEREPSIFKEMKHPSQAVAEFAVDADGDNLQYLMSKFTHIKITESMVYKAIRSCPKALLYAPVYYRTNELKEYAFDKDPSLMMYFDSIEIRPEYKEKVLLQNPANIRYINNPDEDTVCELLKTTPNICVYLKDMTPKMWKILDEYHPAIYQLYSQK